MRKKKESPRASRFQVIIGTILLVMIGTLYFLCNYWGQTINLVDKDLGMFVAFIVTTVIAGSVYLAKISSFIAGIVVAFVLPLILLALIVDFIISNLFSSYGTANK